MALGAAGAVVQVLWANLGVAKGTTSVAMMTESITAYAPFLLIAILVAILARNDVAAFTPAFAPRRKAIACAVSVIGSVAVLIVVRELLRRMLGDYFVVHRPPLPESLPADLPPEPARPSAGLTIAWYTIPLAAAPFTEEMFRVGLYETSKRYAGRVVATCVCVILFALCHPNYFGDVVPHVMNAATIYTGLVAIACLGQYVWWRSLWPPVAVHALANLVLTFMPEFGIRWE